MLHSKQTYIHNIDGNVEYTESKNVLVVGIIRHYRLMLAADFGLGDHQVEHWLPRYLFPSGFVPLLRLACGRFFIFSCTLKVQGIHEAHNM